MTETCKLVGIEAPRLNDAGIMVIDFKYITQSPVVHIDLNNVIWWDDNDIKLKIVVEEYDG